MTTDSNNAARHGQCSIWSRLKDHEFGRQTHGRPEEDTFLPDVAHCLHRIDYEYLASGSEDEQFLTHLTDEQAAEYLSRPVAFGSGAEVRTIRGGEAKVMNRLEVKADNLQFILVIFLGLILLPLGLFNLINGLAKGFAPALSGIGLAILALYGVVVWLVRRGHGRSVKYFSGSGLLHNDGWSFTWADVSRVVNQVRFRPEVTNTKVLFTERIPGE